MSDTTRDHGPASGQPQGCAIEAFRPLVRNTLRGFVRCRFPSGLVIDEIAIHVGAGDGRAWASPPARPMIDRDGAVMRDQRTGKVRYQHLIAFSTPRVRSAWSEQVIAAVRAQHPEALAIEEEVSQR